MVDQALTNGPKPRESGFAYLQFLNGLAKFRAGTCAERDPLLQEAALALSNRAGPRLPRLQWHNFDQATRMVHIERWRRTLGIQLEAPQNEPAPMWTSHILRREAEILIVPQLDEFLQGNYQSKDRGELDALLGAGQFVNHPLTLVRLYADAFSATPGLEKDLRFRPSLPRGLHRRSSSPRSK